ncbi:MAG: hypothetical protein JWN98_695 [Abditibacteriota bacterium]|nr:hypothetical protein [Abditibacteriota bacterium]
MKVSVLSSAVALTVVAGAAQAAPTAQTRTKSVRVVSNAKVLNTAEKASITGMDCGCPEPVELPVTKPGTKPGYGFGAKTEHYGPPGQGFNPYYTWRMQREVSDYTPKGNKLPPTAFKVR